MCRHAHAARREAAAMAGSPVGGGGRRRARRAFLYRVAALAERAYRYIAVSVFGTAMYRRIGNVRMVRSFAFSPEASMARRVLTAQRGGIQ
jgi:hypothetical protein